MPGQALTFNGIAQGFATDLVVGELQAAGAEKVLANIGEYAGFGGIRRVMLIDAAGDLITPRGRFGGCNGYRVHDLGTGCGDRPVSNVSGEDPYTPLRDLRGC